MGNDAPQKICFVICPIGGDDSAIRDRSNKVFNRIISPVVTKLGYEPMRSDHDSRPGKITNQIIRHLVDAPLVVADLTDHNPNVFYELAIRHMVSMPFVHLIQKGQKLPFDIGENRTIFVDHTDLDSVAECMKQLTLQIQEVEKDPSLVENPISAAIERRALEQSGDPTDKGFAEILDRLDRLSARVDRLAGAPRRKGMTVSEIQAALNRYVPTEHTVFTSLLNQKATELGVMPLSRDEFAAAEDAFDTAGSDGLFDFLWTLASERLQRASHASISDDEVAD